MIKDDKLFNFKSRLKPSHNWSCVDRTSAGMTITYVLIDIEWCNTGQIIKV